MLLVSYLISIQASFSSASAWTKSPKYFLNCINIHNLPRREFSIHPRPLITNWILQDSEPQLGPQTCLKQFHASITPESLVKALTNKTDIMKGGHHPAPPDQCTVLWNWNLFVFTTSLGNHSEGKEYFSDDNKLPYLLRVTRCNKLRCAQ